MVCVLIERCKPLTTRPRVRYSNVSFHQSRQCHVVNNFRFAPKRPGIVSSSLDDVYNIRATDSLELPPTDSPIFNRYAYQYTIIILVVVLRFHTEEKKTINYKQFTKIIDFYNIICDLIKSNHSEIFFYVFIYLFIFILQFLMCLK